MQWFSTCRQRGARTAARRRHRLRRLALVTGALTLSTLPLAPRVHADDVVWTGAAGDNLWSDPANWLNTSLSIVVPTSADNVTIGAGNTVNVSADNAAAGWLNNSGTVNVINLYSLNVAQDVFNTGGTLQASGAVASGVGTAFSNSGSFPGYYDYSTTGTLYGITASSINLLGSGNQLSNTGAILAQSGGFIGSQFLYDSNDNLVGATGTYTNVSNSGPSGLLQADGGLVYHSEDSVTTFTNVNPAIYGIIGEVETDSYNSWQASSIQLYGGGPGSSFTNQAGATILASNGGAITLANYDNFTNSGSLIQADGESALYAYDTGSYTVTNPDGSMSGPYSYQYNTVGSSSITLTTTGFGTLNNIDGGVLLASNGGVLEAYGYNDLNNDATSSITASGSGPNSGFSSFLYLSLNNALNNSGLISADTGGELLAYANTITNATGSLVQADGVSNSYSYDVNGNIGLPSSIVSLTSFYDTNSDGQVLATNGGLTELTSYYGNINLTANSLVQADFGAFYYNIYSGLDQFQPSQVELDTYYGGTITNWGQILATNGGSVQVYGEFTNLGSISADGGVYYTAPNLLLYSSAFVSDVDQFNNGGSISVTNAATADLNANNFFNWAGASITVSDNPALLGQLPATEADITALYTLTNAGTIAASSGGIINLTALQTFTNGDTSGNGALIADGAPIGIDGAAYPSSISVLAPTVVNQALIQASNGGQIAVSSDTFTNTGAGHIDVQTGSGLSVTALQSGPALVQNSSTASTHVDGTLSLWNQFTNSRGELVLDGTGGSPGSGGLLYGAGVINGDVTNVNGIVHPGNSPGVLTINGNYTQGAMGILDIDVLSLGGTPGIDASLLDVNGNVSLDGAIDFDFNNFNWSTFYAGDSIDFLEFTGTFQAGPDLSYIGGIPGTYSVLLDPNNPNMLELRANTTVPEPGAPLLLAGAAVALLAARRRRRSRSAL